MNAALVSLEEYLNSSYSPDREYVDGVVVERNVGERPHSAVLSNLIVSLHQCHSGLHVWPILRVRTAPSRVRVPDVCASLEDPRTDILEAPPLICIEILSPADSMCDLMKKLEEYAAMGVRNIWVVDPRRRKAYTYRNRKLEEVAEGRLETEQPKIVLPLDEVFLDL